MNTSEHWIPDDKIGELKDRMADLARRAVKLGCVAPILKVTDETQRMLVRASTVESPWDVYGTFRLVVILSEPICLAGWTFVARVEHTEAGNLFYTAPGQQVPPEYVDAPPTCDHCRADRQRKDTFLVRDDAGVIKQVGSTCIADFLGHALPTSFVSDLDALGDIDEMLEEFHGMRPIPAYSLQAVLALSSAVSRRDGWVSRSNHEQTGRTATADRAATYFFARTDADREDKPEVTELDEERAGKAITWAAALTDEQTVDGYMLNIRTMARGNLVTDRSWGLACSIIAAYARAVEAVERAAVRPPSRHVGTVCKREVFTVTVKRVIDVQGSYGVTHIHKMTDDDGNDLVWFASGTILDEGARYDLKATVKQHGEYGGRPQTVVSRGTVVKEYARVEA